MHELQSLLLQKLPRLSEKKTRLGMDSEGNFTVNGYDLATSEKFNMTKCLNDQTQYIKNVFIAFQETVDFTHADILEALGEDWAMTGDYKLWKVDMGYKLMAETRFYNLTCELPSNISDLSLPEYEETRKQLISLLK